jgi:hypothetical protein
MVSLERCGDVKGIGLQTFGASASQWRKFVGVVSIRLNIIYYVLVNTCYVGAFHKIKIQR